MRTAIESGHAYYRSGLRCLVRGRKTDRRFGKTAEARAKTGTIVGQQFATLDCLPFFEITHSTPHIFHRIQRLLPGTIRAQRFESWHANFPAYREARSLLLVER